MEAWKCGMPGSIKEQQTMFRTFPRFCEAGRPIWDARSLWGDGPLREE